MKYSLLTAASMVVVLSACTLFGVNQAEKTLDGAQETANKVSESVDAVAEKMAEAGSGDAFDGTMKAAMALGVPLKCSWDFDNNSGITYVKGNNMYTEVQMGEEWTKVIVKDKCMWSWGSRDETQGIKLCSEENFVDSEDYEEYAATDSNASYHCLPTVTTDNTFTPPADVDFVDMDAIMNGNSEELQKMMEDSEQ